MKPFGSVSVLWVLAVILGLVGASCIRPLTTDIQPPAPDPRSLTASEPDAATKAEVQAAYGQLPLHFEANQGQSDEQVKFLSRGSGYTLFLTSGEAVLALRQQSAISGQQSALKTQDSGLLSPRPRFGGEGQGEGAVLRMQLVGANPEPQVVGLDELPGKSNYFIGNDPDKWRTEIPHYAKVKYEGLYPGIDLIYYGTQRQLEYDFVVVPGADPKAIALAFEGLVGAGLVPAQEGRSQGSPLQIDDNGDLILHTAGGEIRLHKPRIYQEINGIKQPIPGGYVILPRPLGEGRGEGKHHVSFQVAAYDTSKPLIIDPTLSYSTYLGGSGEDVSNGIAVDASGNAYAVCQEALLRDLPLLTSLTLGVKAFP